MKDTLLLDVLLFLVSNQLSDKTSIEQEKLKIELAEAGISLAKIVKVADWLKELLQSIELESNPKQVLRIFTEEECEKINVVTRGCILFLEQSGALSPVMREWVIDHAMNLAAEKIGIKELQHLLSLVLFQQYGQFNLHKQNKSLIINDSQAVH